MEMDLNEVVLVDGPAAAIMEAIVKVSDTTDQLDRTALADLRSRCETLNEFQLLRAASSLLQAAIEHGEGRTPERGRRPASGRETAA
ncbi:hypothetical protein [Chelatococcus reniformis]|uniref:Uncharacterized protein n=1 Tax=Chelatococcus reniformis TaxID=1494448 RepID=A0A916X849_9HYPH|nr:hypothetical protein [Chelatococcus reniformis]GGC53301.1 hypothetical protein GCM10010994_10440 [Chelatococcus reniformis]